MKTKCIIAPKKSQNKDKVEKITTDLISVVLLCDSPGYRMKSYGPLSLVTINNKKLIDIQISAIKEQFPNFELIVCLGFDSEKVCRYVRTKYKNINIRFVENQLYNVSNSCESLRLSLNNICNNKILICDGNLLLNSKCLSYIDTEKSCALIEKKSCETLEIGLNIDKDNNIQHFSFGATQTWSEILFLNGHDITETLRKIIVNYDSKTRFIFEAINELINMKYELRSILNQSKIMKINNIKTYHSIKDSKDKII